jgi:hypothetical protein
VADHCHVAGTDETIDGPSCRPLLDDFAGVMADRERWPMHLCMETAWASTNTLLMASGTCPWWATVEEVHAAFEYRWPSWPLVIGRAAFKARFRERLPVDGLPVPFELAFRIGSINWIWGALPFEGVEAATFAVRLTSPGLTVDFIGLRRPGQGSARSMIGGSQVIAVGPEVGREAQTTDGTRRTLAAARRW